MAHRSFLHLGIVIVMLLPVLTGVAASPSTIEINQAVLAAAAWQPGQSLDPLRRIEDWVRQAVSEPGQRKEIESGLIKLLGPNVSFETRRFACKQLGIVGGKAALPALAGLLGEAKTTGLACLALTTYPPGQADDLLRSALTSTGGNARVQIIQTLGDRRDRKAVKALAALADADDPAARHAAIVSLAKIGDPSALKALTKVQSSPLAANSSSAFLTSCLLTCADNLAQGGDKKPAREILTNLLDPTQPDHIRRGAFLTLMRLDKDHGIERILEVLRHSDPVLRPVAIAAVQDLPPRTASNQFGALLPGLSAPEQVWLIQSLAARADAPARDLIGKSLSLPSPEVRRAAVSALGQIGDASTVLLLARAASNSKDSDELKAAVSALVQLKGGVQTDQAIISELKRSNSSARARLIEAIAQREGIGANGLLLQEADNPDPVVAKTAFRSLVKTATASNAASLLTKLSNPLPRTVRPEAEAATAAALNQIDQLPQRFGLVREAYSRANTSESLTSFLNLLPGCPTPISPIS